MEISNETCLTIIIPKTKEADNRNKLTTKE